MSLSNFLDGQTVLVTGAAGSIGRALVEHLLENNKTTLRAVDHNEDGVFSLQQAFGTRAGFTTSVADIRDANRMVEITSGVDTIFHCAALKHVLVCEHSPNDAVATNVVGPQHLIRSAIQNRVSSVVLTSTDKAVNPTNVMGTSKLMSERLITAANNYSSGVTAFSSTRFGNVLGTRGSVYRVFLEQIRAGGPVTITDPAMTRFIMSVDEALHLILSAAKIAQGGEVFVPKMKHLRIVDLADAMIELLAPQFGHDPSSIPIKEIGIRPGEKVLEELMTVEEAERSQELDSFYAILPPAGSMLREINYTYTGGSQRPAAVPLIRSDVGTPLSKDEISVLLQDEFPNLQMPGQPRKREIGV
jgi:FlaA1/EpsC-like NDP-sugar epimerase